MFSGSTDGKEPKHFSAVLQSRLRIVVQWLKISLQINVGGKAMESYFVTQPMEKEHI